MPAQGGGETRNSDMDSGLYNLIKAGRGQIPCDLLFVGGWVLNVFTRRFEKKNVAVYGGKIVGIDEPDSPREAVKTEDATGKYIVPSFIDAHVHLESSMLTPEFFAEAVLPRGTGCVVVDPHEYANVVGVEIIDYLQRAAEVLPLDIYINIPSGVLCSPFEHNGARLDSPEIKAVLDKNYPNVIGLAEFMNVPGVLSADPEILKKLEAAEGRHIDGHSPFLTGRDLQAYVSVGIRTDHECTTAEEAMEKLSLGMYVMIREGSFTRDVKALYPIVNEAVLDRLLLCTDDREPEDLADEGHIDFVCRKLIDLGVKPEHVFIMASWNSARCFGLSGRGAIAPGYKADFNILEAKDGNFSEFKADRVYIDGKLIAEGGRYLGKTEPVDLGDLKKNSVNVSDKLSEEDLRFKVEEAGRYEVKAIGAIPDVIITESLKHTLEASAYTDAQGLTKWELKASSAEDILKIAVIERHHALENVGLGFINGLGIKGGAIASSVAHDSHNIVVAGDSDADMWACVQELKRIGGGLAVASQGQVKASLALPVCGLTVNAPLEEVRSKIDILYREAEKLHSSLKRPFMCMAFMALTVVPHLKISDMGLFDADNFTLTEAAGKL